MVRTIRLGNKIKIGAITIELKEIDPQWKWVKLDIQTTEHVTVTKAQTESTTR